MMRCVGKWKLGKIPQISPINFWLKKHKSPPFQDVGLAMYFFNLVGFGKKQMAKRVGFFLKNAL